MFRASIETPESPFVVADTILGAVEGKDTRLRLPCGRDAEAFIRSRTSRTDEKWVNLGLMSDAEFTADMKSRIGIDVKL